MARKGAVQVEGQPMTTEDMQLVEQRIEGKRAPLHEEDHPLPKGRLLETEDGRKITQVGKFQGAPSFGDSQTLKKFSRIEPDYTGWIKMGNEEVRLYQELRLLIGHDGDKKLGLIDERKLLKIKELGKKGQLSDKDTQALEQLEAIK